MHDNYRDNPDIVENFIGHRPSGDVVEPTRVAIDRLGAAVSYLASRDATFLFGTDTPSSPTYTNPPGLNGLLEIMALAELGLDERQLFEALTLNNARAFGIEDTVGTVEAGKQANLLLLRENPLESVGAWDTLDIVIINGRAVERRALLLSND